MCHLWDWLKNERTDVYKDCRICDLYSCEEVLSCFGRKERVTVVDSAFH